MEFLSEDPTYLAGGLGLLAATFFIALRVTQQGKYLLFGLAALAAMATVLVVEQLWVTDNERIEEVVYGLGRAVAASDTQGVLDRVTPDVQFVVGGSSLFPGETTRSMIEARVAAAHFDFLRITQLRTNAGGQSRRGTAEFKVAASGSFQGSYNTLNFGSANSTWSLGLRETSPGVWKINRITPVSVPGGQNVIPTAGFRVSAERPTAPSTTSERLSRSYQATAAASLPLFNTPSTTPGSRPPGEPSPRPAAPPASPSPEAAPVP